MEQEYLTVAEAAAILKVAQNTVRNWLKSGKLKGSKIERLWRIRAADLDEFIKSWKPSHGPGSVFKGMRR